jgi:hypothetical protein
MNKTRFLLFVFIIIIIAAAIIPYVFFGVNFLIDQWHIPIDPPGFYDSRQFAMGAESYYQGYDPLVTNPANDRGLQLNYPRIWHVLFPLVVDQSRTNIMGSIVVIIFFIGLGIFWFSRKYDNLTYYVLFIITLSPVVMLGVERANIDLIVFFVLALALTANYYSRISGVLLLLFASILKIFPVFGFIYLLKEEKRRFWTLFLASLGIFALYALLTLNDLYYVYTTTSKGVSSSYGINVWWKGIGHHRFFNLPLSETMKLFLQVVSFISAIIIITTTLYLSLRQEDQGIYREGRYIDAFRMGAGIYTGSFFVMTNNDYRLTFLIFTVPQLVEWLSNKEKGIRGVPFVTLIAMLFSLWSDFIMRFLGRNLTFVIEEFANWVILTGFVYLLFTSLPDWFKDYFRHSFSFIKSSDTKSTAN